MIIEKSISPFDLIRLSKRMLTLLLALICLCFLAIRALTHTTQPPAPLSLPNKLTTIQLVDQLPTLDTLFPSRAEDHPPSLTFFKDRLKLRDGVGRPDLWVDRTTLPILLNSNLNETAIDLPLGTPFYLDYDLPTSSLVLSEVPTPFKAQITPHDRHRLVCHVDMHLQPTHGGKPVQAQITFDLTSTPATTDRSDRLETESILDLLRTSRWYGHDQLVERYGGECYLSCKGAALLFLHDADGDERPLYLQTGETLILEQDRLVTVDLGTRTRLHPLLEVETINPDRLHLTLWTVDGQEQIPIILERQTASPLSDSRQVKISQIKQHTLASVSCRLDQEVTILKEGDWLLQSGKRWCHIHQTTELDDILQFRRRGQLLIIDRVAQQSGKIVIEATLFNQERAELKAICLQSAPTSSHNLPREEDARSNL